HEMTMAEFITLATQDELHPKHNITEEKNLGNMRTLAFQVPEELFQKIKEYLQRNNMTQKEFVIGLIETEIERDLTQRAAQSETQIQSEEETEGQTERQETATMSDCEDTSVEVEKQPEKEENAEISDDFEGENEETEELGEDEELEELDEQNEEQIEEQEETEDMGMSMGI
ncbi:MAG: hypothetical protein NC452_21505, partial [Eubacterium sp.]|nr:hypothetical protein [Eubacterium sp.]